MKKLLILLCSIELIFLPVCVFADGIIEDDFAKTELKNVSSLSKQVVFPIKDDFAEKTLKNIRKTSVYKNEITDEFAQISLKGKKSNVRINTNYDYTSLERTVLKINPMKTISSTKRFKEGEEVSFINKNEIKINSVTVPKGAEIIGRVETISPSSLRGVPSQLIIDNFYLKSNPDIYFVGSIEKTGARRYIWVYPSAMLITPLFGLGAFLWLVKGGHAKIRKRQTFEIFYAEN